MLSSLIRLFFQRLLIPVSTKLGLAPGIVHSILMILITILFFNTAPVGFDFLSLFLYMSFCAFAVIITWLSQDQYFSIWWKSHAWKNNKLDSYEPSLYQAQMIIKEYANILHNDKHIIHNAELLPYPKILINKALNIVYDYVSNMDLENIKQYFENDELRKAYLSHMSICQMGLTGYHYIEHNDINEVSWINNQYKSFNDITAEILLSDKELFRLIGKYPDFKIE